jgi:ETC complex I subunit conserved region
MGIYIGGWIGMSRRRIIVGNTQSCFGLLGNRPPPVLVGVDAGSGDYMQGTRMAFSTKEDAIAFAEKQGWEYYIQEPHNRQFKPKAYATNFNYCIPSKAKLFLIGSGEEVESHHHEIDSSVNICQCMHKTTSEPSQDNDVFSVPPVAYQPWSNAIVMTFTLGILVLALAVPLERAEIVT